MGSTRPDEKLAQAGARNRHIVIGPGACPDKGRVADPAGILIESAPRGGRRRKVSPLIESDRPDGTMCRAGPLRSVLDVVTVVSRGIIDEPKAPTMGEGKGPLTCQQNLIAISQHLVSCLDRVHHTAYGRDCPRLLADTIHDACIELYHPLRIWRRSFAGDVKTGFFHHLDERNHSLQSTLAREELVPASGNQRAHVVFLLIVVEHWVCPRAPVDNNGVAHEIGPIREAPVTIPCILYLPESNVAPTKVPDALIRAQASCSPGHVRAT